MFYILDPKLGFVIVNACIPNVLVSAWSSVFFLSVIIFLLLFHMLDDS